MVDMGFKQEDLLKSNVQLSFFMLVVAQSAPLPHKDSPTAHLVLSSAPPSRAGCLLSAFETL